MAVDDERVAEAAADTLDDLFAGSRSGARSARGFHYQDTVATWLAARMLTREEDFSRIVPEGHEDISCDGNPQLHVQVKSRARGSGEFTVSEVATVISQVWAKDARRRNGGAYASRLAVVLERPVGGFSPNDWSTSLSTNPHGLGILEAVLPKIAEYEWDEHRIGELADHTVVVVLPSDVAEREASLALARIKGMPPVVGHLAARALREELVAATDSNATTDSFATASGIDRQAARVTLHRIRELANVADLNTALSDGLCELLDFSGEHDAQSFYEGVSCQPGHVGSGLVVQRDELSAQVAQAASQSRPAILTGPSGVGKSAALWGAAHRMNHVTWYRVNRLAVADVMPLIKLAKASFPTMAAPVGLILDGVDDQSASGWDELVRSLSHTTNILLVGSARTENLLTLRTLAECEQVEVKLTAAVAERIFEALESTGRTAVPHWREAFEDTHGLTLEFTHLLTRGQRLEDILAGQVAARVREARETELRVLAVVATMHQWDGALRLETLEQIVGERPGNLRAALARLHAEHLIRNQSGQVSGLHALRSRALSRLTHAYPPPDTQATVVSLLERVDASEIGKVVRGALTERSCAEQAVLVAVAARMRDSGGSQVAGEVFAALRAADIALGSEEWQRILTEHRVDRALWITTLGMAQTGNDAALPFKDGVNDAIPELRQTLGNQSRLLGVVCRDLGPDFMSSILWSCKTPGEAARLLSHFAHANLTGIFNSGRPIVEAPLASSLARASLDEVAELLATARVVEPTLAIELLESSGGQDAVFERLRGELPWATRLELVESDGEPLPTVRFVHISDDLQGDPDRYTRDCARLVLRLFPQAESVDVSAEFPDGSPITVGDHRMGVSRFQRRHDHSWFEVEWNRRLLEIAATEFGAPTATERASHAREICDEAAEFVALLGRVWVSGRNRTSDKTALVAHARSLELMGRELVTPVARATAANAPTAAPANDALGTLVDGLVNRIVARLSDSDSWRPLAAYLGDTLRRSIGEVRRQEKWYLLGSGPPPSLDAMAATLGDLHSVVAERAFGTTSPKDIVTAARSGPSAQSLARAANLSKRAARTRHERAWAQVQAGLRARGIKASVATEESWSTSAVLWPHIDVAIGVEVEDVAEWAEALQVITALLSSDADPIAQAVGIDVLPIYPSGTPASQVMKVSSLVVPVPEHIDRWHELVRTVIPTPVSDSAQACLANLSLISAIAMLREPPNTTAAQRACDDATARFRESFERLQQHEPRGPACGALLEHIADTAERVQDEADGHFDADDDYVTVWSELASAAIAALHTSGQSELTDTPAHFLALALSAQLDIDERVADGMFE
jgi:hypothetical protein